MSSTYANVDGSGDPVGAAAWMDTMAAWPSVRAYKDRTIALLRDADRLVDIGCGVGDDARALGAVGLDPSVTMLEVARARGGAFVRGDVLALPFASASLDGLRTDRVLQHVPDPDHALREVARVLRAGGLAVFAEPDQSTLRIDGTDDELTPGIVRFRTESIQNAALGDELAERVARLGFGDVQRESFRIEIDDPSLAFGLPTWPEMLVERGEWADEDAARFSASLDSTSFLYSFDVVVTWARR